MMDLHFTSSFYDFHRVIILSFYVLLSKCACKFICTAVTCDAHAGGGDRALAIIIQNVYKESFSRVAQYVQKPESKTRNAIGIALPFQFVRVYNAFRSETLTYPYASPSTKSPYPSRIKIPVSSPALPQVHQVRVTVLDSSHQILGQTGPTPSHLQHGLQHGLFRDPSRHLHSRPKV